MIHSKEYNNLIFQFSFKTIILLVSNIIIAVLLIDSNYNKLLFVLSYLIISISIFLFLIKRDILEYDAIITGELTLNAEYKSILTNTNLPLIITDGNDILFYNSAALNLFRCTSKEMETYSILDLIDENYKQSFSDFLIFSKEDQKISFKLANNINSLLDRFASFSIKRSTFKGKDCSMIVIYETEQFHSEEMTIENLNILYKQAINNLSDSIIIFDSNEKVIFINDYAKINSHIGSKTDFSTMIEDDINRNILNTGFRIALEGTEFVDEGTYREDDKEKWIHISFVPIKLPDGNAFVEYVIKDVSSYKNEVVYLSEQLNNSTQFVDKTNSIITLWDENGNFIRGNNKFYDISKIDLKTLQEENLNLFKNNYFNELSTQTIIFNNDNLEKRQVFTKNSIRAGIKNYYDLVANGKDFEVVICCSFNPSDRINKKYNWYQNKNYPTFTEDGKLTAFVLEFVDVSDYYSLLDKYDISKKYLDTIANNFNAGILFIVDKNSNVVFVGGDKKIRQNIGFAGLSTHSSSKISNMLNFEEFVENFSAAFEGNYTRTSTNILDTLYEIQFIPIRDEYDIVNFCMGIGFDSSERDKYEKQLILQKNYHETIFNESAIMSLIFDTEGNIINGNTKAFEYVNSSLERMTKVNMYNSDAILNQEIVHKSFEQALEGIRPPQFELNIAPIRNDNLHIKSNSTLLCNCYPIMDANKQVHTVIINFIDVTETRTLINELQKTQAISNIVTSNFPDGILIIFDSNLNFLLFDGKNDIELLNMQKLNLIGANLKNIDTEITNNIRPYIIETVTSRKKMNFDISFELDDDEIYYNTTILPVLNKNDEIEYIYVCLVNITTTKQLEEIILEFNTKLEADVATRTKQLQETTVKLEEHVSELQFTQDTLIATQNKLTKALEKEKELNAMKTYFISTISHEFRTPLTVIQTYAYLLDTYYDTKDRKQFDKGIQKIISTVDIMTNLLDSILFFDEIKNHKLLLTMVEIYQFIFAVKEETIMRYNAKQKIILNTNINKELIILTDEKLLSLIISNLLSNAIKYSPNNNNTEIIMEFEDRKDDFIITVQDFGSGIPDDVIEHLFDTFIRSQSVTNISGIGLGLPTVQNCVDVLKGEIKFETEKNVGTKFIVRLPKLKA